VSRLAVEHDLLGAALEDVASFNSLAVGRRALHSDAVLPWAAYEDGTLPCKWWQDTLFAGAIAEWRIEGVERSSVLPETDVRKIVGRGVESMSRAEIIHISAITEKRHEEALGIRHMRIEKIEQEPWRWYS
jgi:hypothetical protein